MKQQSIKYFTLPLLIAVLVAPSFVLAAWWNPFSWNWDIFNIFSKPKTHITKPNNNLKKQPSPETVLATALRYTTLSYPDPNNSSKNDTFTLANGIATITDAGKSRTYDVTATAIGDLDDDGIAEGVIGLYQKWAANKPLPIIFVVSNKNGILSQISYALPDYPSSSNNTQIKSLFVNDEILFVNLFIQGKTAQDKKIEKTIQYKLLNGKLIVSKTSQNTGWKTYINNTLGFSISYPWDWSFNLTDNKLDIFCDFQEKNLEPCEGLVDTGIGDVGPDINVEIKEISLSNYIEEYNKEGKPFGAQIINQEEYELSGIKGSKMTATTAIGLDKTIIFVTKNSKSYIISFTELAGEVQYKILSTFKLTN